MSENDETIRSGSDLAIMKTEPRPKWNKNIFKIHTSFVFQDCPGEFEQINRKFISDASLPP